MVKAKITLVLKEAKDTLEACEKCFFSSENPSCYGGSCCNEPEELEKFSKGCPDNKYWSLERIE